MVPCFHILGLIFKYKWDLFQKNNLSRMLKCWLDVGRKIRKKGRKKAREEGREEGREGGREVTSDFAVLSLG